MQAETGITLTMHGLTLAGIFSILGLLLRQHGIWIRMKDRLNSLWRDRCLSKGDEYVPLENGRR